MKHLFHGFDSYSTFTSFYSTKIPFFFTILFHAPIVLFRAPIYFFPRSPSFISRKQVLFHKWWNNVESTLIPHNSTGCLSTRCLVASLALLSEMLPKLPIVLSVSVPSAASNLRLGLGHVPELPIPAALRGLWMVKACRAPRTVDQYGCTHTKISCWLISLMRSKVGGREVECGSNSMTKVGSSKTAAFLIKTLKSVNVLLSGGSSVVNSSTQVMRGVSSSIMVGIVCRRISPWQFGSGRLCSSSVRTA